MYNTAFKKIAGTLTLLGMFCFQQFAHAVVLIETKEEDGSSQKMYIQGLQVRIDTTSDPGYVIMNAKDGTMFAVNHREKQLVDIGDMAKQSKSKTPITHKFDIQFVKKGRGPKIAGYSTTHYTIVVDGEKCSDEYISSKVLKDLAVEDTIEKLADMFRDIEPSAMGVTSDSPCDAAESKIGEMYLKYGYPMRSLNEDGALESEVISVNKKASAPLGGFDRPTGYKVVNMGKMMEGLSSMQPMTPEAMQNMDPEQMRQMMEQMGQQMQKQMQQK